ncbi:STAS domain-containing protein [Undibacterium sp. Jales W-56]|uniref:STAS domain-containing protein n=1 Tax=Undibacterium sp. Jales W-56 TaxID=2897325 RepID=UPI0021D38001|nr:STAS domain-containing protein [Undibacterium sp. Jales W-56]MCU6435094.1 STAS domain-containing protein [Undibacterium sp. Jales W-56]
MYQTSREINLKNALGVAQAGLSEIAKGVTAFDLSALTVVDSSAVAVMLDWQRAASVAGKTMEFHSVPANLISLISLYGVAELLGITASSAGRH